MAVEVAGAVLLGAAASGLAAAAGFALLARDRRRAGRIGTDSVLRATALRFGLTLLGALGLALGLDRSDAVPALAGLGATYLALLVVETRWAMGRTRTAAAPGNTGDNGGL